MFPSRTGQRQGGPVRICFTRVSFSEGAQGQNAVNLPIP